MKTTTYLAIMPRHRRPRAVPPSAVSFYRQNAARFYEAPDMTAEQARAAIAEGALQPTYVAGQRTGAGPDSRALSSLTALTLKASLWMDSGMPGAYHHARLWIGSRFATLQRCNCTNAGPVMRGARWHWHYAAGAAGSGGAQCDVLYEMAPLTGGDVERAYGNRVRLDLLTEDHANGHRTSDVGRPWRCVESWDLDGALSALNAF